MRINSTIQKPTYDNSDEGFELLIKEHIDDYFTILDKKLERHAYPGEFLKEQVNNVHSSLTGWHNSDIKLNEAFFNVLKQKQEDKYLGYFEAFKGQFKRSIKKQKLLFEFSAKIIAFKRILSMLNKKLTPETEIISEPEGITQTEPKRETETARIINNSESEEFKVTLARTVLIFHYLMDGFLEDGYPPDKTSIAKFIDSIINSNSQTENIVNSNLYKKVKALFFSPEKASISDLNYVRGRFRTLGMESIVEDIDSILTKRKTKN